jgi:hypothetical protein
MFWEISTLKIHNQRSKFSCVTNRRDKEDCCVTIAVYSNTPARSLLNLVSVACRLPQTGCISLTPSLCRVIIEEDTDTCIVCNLLMVASAAVSVLRASQAICCLSKVHPLRGIPLGIANWHE